MIIKFEGERPRFSRIVENGSKIADAIAFIGDFPIMRDERNHLLDIPLQSFELTGYRERGVRGVIRVDKEEITLIEEGSSRTLRLFNGSFRSGLRIIEVISADNPLKGNFGRIYPIEHSSKK